MGSIMCVRCRSCDYSETFLTGFGMEFDIVRFFDLEGDSEKLKEIIASQDEFEYVKALFQKEKNKLTRYGSEIYYCSGCNAFSTHFFIHLEHEGGWYEIEHKCLKCGDSLRRIYYNQIPYSNSNIVEYYVESNLNDCGCPKCQKCSLYMDQRIGCWD